MGNYQQAQWPDYPQRIRVAVLGCGGLGRSACQIIGEKKELCLTAICDSKGLLVCPEGLDCESLAATSKDLVSHYLASTEQAPGEAQGCRVSVATALTARHCEDALGAMIEFVDEFDAVLITLPNMPNDFIPGVVERFVRSSPGLVFVDVLKRGAAVEQMFELDDLLKQTKGVALTGCGATPGLLTAAAVLAAQSFIEIERVDIFWGVGVSNWDAYKATIREDIAHVPGYTLQRARAMTDAEVEAFLAKTGGLLELHHMEHADDFLLERVGVVQSRQQVEVGGIMDTRHPRKPVSTTVTVTGITFEGRRSTHRFILGDETSMAANVIGPALGYLKRGLWLKQHGIFGVFGSSEFLPMVVR